MKRLFFLPALLVMLPGPAAAVSYNGQARIAVHLRQPVAKNSCSVAPPTCFGINTQGTLYPTGYFAYILVTDVDMAAGFRGVSFGVTYDGDLYEGVDIYSWHGCADLEFPGAGWPAPGTGNLLSWTSCPTLVEPDGPGTGGTAVAGYSTWEPIRRTNSASSHAHRTLPLKSLTATERVTGWTTTITRNSAGLCSALMGTRGARTHAARDTGAPAT